MSTDGRTIDLPVTLHVSQTAQETLARRAAESGTDLAGYVSALVEQAISGQMTLEELSGPIHERFLASGTTDDELADELEEAKHKMRAEKRNKRAS
jgi:hypothetical protein